MTTIRACTFTLLLALAAFAGAARAIGYEFSYQGTLLDADQPANGVYDLEFDLLDGNDVSVLQPSVVDDVAVVDGVFTVQLNFGAAAFTGSDRRLRIGVRPGASSGTFTLLSPTTPITPTPYAQTARDALIAASVAWDSIDSNAIVDGSVQADDVDTSQVQRRVSGNCSSGQTIASISASGTVTCTGTQLGTATLAVPGVNLSLQAASNCQTNTGGITVQSDGTATLLAAGTYLITMPTSHGFSLLSGLVNSVNTSSSGRIDWTLLGPFGAVAFGSASMTGVSPSSNAGLQSSSAHAPTSTFSLSEPGNVLLRANAYLTGCGSVSVIAGNSITVLKIQ